MKSSKKREFTDKLGKKHLLLCNPVGYPDEKPYAEYGLKREDFLIDLDTPNDETVAAMTEINPRILRPNPRFFHYKILFPAKH